MKSLLKLATASAALFFAGAGAPLHAQAPMLTHTLAFASEGSTTPLRTFDALSISPDGDGTRTFKLDLIFKSSDVPVLGLGVLMLFIEEDLEVINIENIARADTFDPSLLSELASADRVATVNGVEYAKAYIWGWTAVTSISAVANPNTYVRLLTATIKLKKAAGDTTVDFSSSANDPADVFTGTQLTIQGPPLATLTAAPTSIQATAGAAGITATCGLSRPAIEETTCTLAVQSGSTAALTGDYTVSPAIDGATIVIPKGDTSKMRTFNVTPLLSGDGGTIDIDLGSVTADGKAVAWDMEAASVTILTPGLVIAPLSKPLAESILADFKLHLRTQPASDVVVDITSSDISEATVAPASLTFTTGNWQTDQTVTLTGVDDGFDDGDIPYTITLEVDDAKTSDTNYHGISDSFSGTNADNDSTTISLSAVPAVLSESAGAQNVVITASLSGGILVEAATGITLGIGSGTAVAGTDYTAFTPPALTISANMGAGSITIPITTTADSTDDNGETIVITATLAPYTIAPLTLPIHEFRLDATSLSGNTGEDESKATFTLVLPSRPASGEVVVDVRSSDLTEATLSPTTLTFTTGNWESPQTVTVTGVDDRFDDGDMPYTVNLAVDNDKTDDAHYHDLTQSVSGSNTDDDTAEISITAAPAFLTEDAGAQNVVITARLSGGTLLEADAEVTLGTGGGTATAGTDYTAFTPSNITIPAGMASGSVTVPITTATDSVDDSGETIVITAASSPYTIPPLALRINEFALKVSALSGNTGEDGSTAFFTLVLPTAPLSGEVVVDVKSLDPTEAIVSPATLIFTTGNWNAPQRVVVTGIDDSLADGDADYTLTIAVDDDKTDDDNYDGRMATLAGKNTDNDTAMIALRAAPSFLSEAGGEQSITITAELAGATRLATDAVVALGKGSGTATEGTDYATFTLPPSITIPASQASAAITFSITPMTAATNGETIVITGTLSPYAITDLTLTILEFGLNVGAPSGQVTEAGGAASIAVQLISAPSSGKVTVKVSSSDSSEATLSPAELIFTTSNWNMPQSVTVTGVDDVFDDDGARYTVDFSVDNPNTDDTNYHNLTESVPIATLDDDAVMISLSVGPEFLVEHGGAQQVVITATLSGSARLENDAAIVLRDGGGTATVSGDYKAFPQPSITILANANTGAATFSIEPTADELDDSGETILFAATLPPYDITGITLPIRQFELYPSALRGKTGEDGSTATFQLALPSAPASGDVVVKVMSEDSGEARAAPATLTFTANNWDMPQTVTVTGADDNFDDGDANYVIGLAVDNPNTPDTNYHGMSASVSGVNADDDTAVITLSADPAFLIEDQGEQTVMFTATIGGDIRFEDARMVMLGDSGGSATAGGDYTAFTPPVITIPMNTASGNASVAITTASDAVDDNNENIVITGALADYTIAPLNLPIREYALKASASGITTTESGGSETFTLGLTSAPSGDVVVDVVSGDASEAAAAPAKLTFTTTNWETPQQVTVTGQPDDFDDGDANYEIKLTVNDAATEDDGYDGRMASVAGVNTDEDTAEIAMKADPLFLNESGGAQRVVITAMLSGAVRFEEDTAVMLGKGGGSATEVADYAAFSLPASVTIPMGEAAGTATFSITPVDDGMDDEGETILITTTLTPYDIPDITLTIRELGLIAGALGGDTGEDESSTTFTLALSAQPASGEVVVDVTSSDASEAKVSPEVLRFGTTDWNTPQTVTVTGVNDNFDDGDRDYMIILAINASETADTNYKALADTVITGGKNIDDDAAMIVLTASHSVLTKAGGAQAVVITASLSGGILLEEDATIVLSEEGAGTATAGTDYTAFSPPSITIPAEKASAGASVSITPLAAATDGESIIIAGALSPYTIAPLTLTIRELGLIASALSGQATEAGGSATFTLRLAAAPASGNVIVDVTSSDTGEAEVSPAMLTFTTSNWNMPQSVIVTGKDDKFDDGDAAYTVTLAVNSRTDDANYHDITESLSGVNTDNDAAMITLSASPAFLTESGGAQNVVITAALTAPILLQEDAVIMLGKGGTAAEGVDYETFTPPASITIPAEQAAASVTFPITTTADVVADDGESIIITGAFAPYTIAGLPLLIREIGIVVGALSGNTTEAGGTATFTLALSTAPSGPVSVVIAPAAADSGEVRVVRGYEIANFTATDYGQTTPKNVLLAGVDDKILDGERRFTINLTAASATDSNYDGLTATATGANDDDETAPAKLTLRAHPSAIPETAGAVDVVVVASFDSGVSVLSATTVTLSAPKDGDAPGDLVADSSTDYAAAPAIARATITIPARMSAGFATFRITPTDDMLPDPGEKIVISGAAAGSDVAISGAANITDAEITLTEKGLAQVAAVVNRTLLPVTSQRGLAGAMADIESRAGATRDSRTNYTLAGHASTQSALLGYLKAAADAADGDVRYDWKRALADSSFVMPLNGAGGGAVWAAGDYGALDGESNQVEWEGDVFGMNFGADTRVGGALLGAMVSFVDSEAEYTDSNAGSVNRGTYTQRTTSLRPYFAWASGATEVWGSIGGGAGSVEFIDTGPGALTTKASSDISEASLSLGLKRRLGEGFSLKADAALLASRVDEKKDREGRVVVDKQEIESARTRLLLDSRKTYSRANGEISPSMQVGLRYDVIEDERRGIDSEQGSAGVEVVLGMDFVNFASGLTLSGKARIYDGEDYDEWGVSGSIILQPSGGRGLSLRMRPLYGDAQSSVRRVWERDFGEQPGGGAPDYAASMRGELGYAFNAPGGRGLLTPYTEATLGGAAANHRLGLRWQPHSRFDVDAHGENRDAANDYRINFHWAAKRRFDFTLSAERSEGARVRHAVMLKGAVGF